MRLQEENGALRRLIKLNDEHEAAGGAMSCRRAMELQESNEAAEGAWSSMKAHCAAGEAMRQQLEEHGSAGGS
ncbi:MAG: hypothetical protein MHMPM18_002071 [Marteilia pararefringens]